MRKSERLFEIVQILRRERAPIAAARIAEELGVSKRSVYRDISALVGQGVPVEGEPGIGYVLGAGFDMPPLMLTSDEIDAAVLGALWVGSRGEPELATAARNLIVKLEAVAPQHLRGRILAPSTSVRPVRNADPEGVSSSAMRNAIARHQKVHLDYTSRDGEASQRTVWPILLGYRDDGRILAAWCEMRQGFRYFRTDRMTSARILYERIPERADLLRARWDRAMAEERARYTAGEP